MLHPTIDELTHGKFNRYELALATARCARLITDEYVRQHAAAEKSKAENKGGDRSLILTVDRELRDDKAVKVAVNRIYRGIYEIDLHAEDHPENAEELWEAGNEAELKLEEAEEEAEEAKKAQEAEKADNADTPTKEIG